MAVTPLAKAPIDGIIMAKGTESLRTAPPAMMIRREKTKKTLDSDAAS